MPEVNTNPRRQLLAAVMVISSIVLFALSMLIFTGVVPMPDAVRIPATIVILLAAAVDLVIALVFFRKGQSS
jgi:lipopolysaccharide export LptBFGC system permease protein LptF